MNLVLPERFSDESGYGYVQRALHENGLGWGWMCSRLGISSGVLSFGSDTPQIIDLFEGGVSNDDFVCRHVNEFKAARLNLYQQTFMGRWQILGEYQKVCPTCLIQGGYSRKLWDLDMTSVCHIHRTSLTRRCMNCVCAVSWFRKSYRFCRCGMPFGSAMIERSENDLEVIWSSWLNQRVNNFGLPNYAQLAVLENLSLGVLVQLIKILGLSALAGNLWSKSLRSHTGDQQVSGVINHALQILAGICTANSEKCVALTHYQELGFERLLHATTSHEELKTLCSIYKGVTGRSPSLSSQGLRQLPLDFDHE